MDVSLSKLPTPHYTPVFKKKQQKQKESFKKKNFKKLDEMLPKEFIDKYFNQK